jgi:hypothetical protein
MYCVIYVDEYGDLNVINKYSTITKEKITSAMLSTSGITLLRKTISVMDNVIIGKIYYINVSYLLQQQQLEVLICFLICNYNVYVTLVDDNAWTTFSYGLFDANSIKGFEGWIIEEYTVIGIVMQSKIHI